MSEKKENFIEVIENCLTNLEKPYSNKDKLSEIIVMKIINNIRLWFSDNKIKLNILNKIFEKKSFIKYENINKQIILSYEQIREKIEDINTISDIDKKIEILKNEKEAL